MPMPMVTEVQLVALLTFDNGKIVQVISPPFTKNNRGCRAFTDADVIRTTKACNQEIRKTIKRYKSKGIYKLTHTPTIGPSFSEN
jgi:hypothetical protein